MGNRISIATLVKWLLKAFAMPERFVIALFLLVMAVEIVCLELCKEIIFLIPLCLFFRFLIFFGGNIVE